MRMFFRMALLVALFFGLGSLAAQAAPEKKTTQYANGSKHEEIEVFSGKRHGVYKKWDESGALRAEGNYFADVMHGRWTYFHANGAKSLEGEYFAGFKHGAWLAFHANGKQAESGEFKNGVREGEACTWYEDGASQSKGRFVNGAEEGLWTRWHPGGKKALEAEYVKGAQTGAWREWGVDGVLVYDGRKLNGEEVAVSTRPGARGTEGIIEYHLFSAVEGSRMSGAPRLIDGREQCSITVVLTRTRLPQVLVLCGYEPISWKIELGNGVELKRVILGGFYDQEVIGLPRNVEVVAKFASRGDPDRFYPGGDDSGPNGRPRMPGEGLQDTVEKFIGQRLTLTGPTGATQSGAVFGRTAERKLIPPEGCEVHVVGCYEGTLPGGRQRRFRERATGDVSVEVSRQGAPILLVLCAYDSVRWILKAADGVEIAAVLLSGYYKQEVMGLPAGIAVHSASYEDRPSGRGERYFYCYQRESREYSTMCTTLRDMTGLEVSSFTGGYRLSEAKVEVANVKAPPPPLDAELHVISFSAAANKGASTSTIKVQVSRKGAPLVLVLLADGDVAWELVIDPEVNVERVILGGKGQQTLKGRPPSAYLAFCTDEHNDGETLPFCDSEADKAALGESLKKLLGLAIASSVKASSSAASIK